MKKVLLAGLLIANGIVFSQSTNPTPYCDASFDDVDGTFPIDDHINSVVFGDLSYADNSQYAAPHYVFYNNIAVANFYKDSTYELRLSFKVAGGCGYGVWIDYNQDNNFDISERIAGTTGTDWLDLSSGNDSTVVTTNITIPTSAVTGTTRLRIRIVEDDNHNMTTTEELPCNASSSPTDIMDWGETEDYTINIKEASTAGISMAQQMVAFKIYPNPSNGIVYFSSQFDGTIKIVNVAGKTVVKRQHTGSQKTAIDLTSFPKGIYFGQFTTEQGQSTQKLVIK